MKSSPINALLVACLAALSQMALPTFAASKPNIIFVLTDDQRCDELGFMNPVLNTPSIDTLAAEGVRF